VPEKVLPDVASFEWFERKLQALGFRPISGFEFQTDFRRLGLKAPRSRVGREAGFIFYANELTVWVWTTWLRSKEVAREVDAGWVLIRSRDTPLYFIHPLHRTKHFLVNLFRHAWLARWRVIHRPLCPECHQFMDIVAGRGMKSRYWRCDRLRFHRDGKPVSLDWDHGLPPKAKRYVKILRGRRAAYRLRREQEGKPTNVALIRRKLWQRSN